MNKEERKREKELKRLIYLREELLKQTKKQLKENRRELEKLGNNRSRNRRK